MRLGILILGIVLLIAPASAIITNNTANDAYYENNVTLISGSFLHDAAYMPKDYVFLIILLGIVFWALAIASPVCQDLFSIITPCFFAVGSWYAGYMTKEVVSIVVSGNTIYPVHTQVITPSPVIQTLCLIATVLSILSAIYIIFLSEAPIKTKKESDTSHL